MYNQPESSLTLIVDSIFDKPFFDRHIVSAAMCLLAFIENLLEETVNACCFQFLPSGSLWKRSSQIFVSPLLL